MKENTYDWQDGPDIDDLIFGEEATFVSER